MEILNCAYEGKLILKECIHPKFKSEGFKKSGNTFYRVRGEFIDVVNVQFGRSNSKDYSYFTYNIKISMPSFYEKFNMHREKNFEYCIIDDSLGRVISIMNNLHPVDYWYKIGHCGPHIEIKNELIRNGCNTPGITPERIEELKEEIKTLKLLESRYDFKNIEQIRKTIIGDIDTAIIPFFNKIENTDALAKLLDSKKFLIPMEKFFLFIYLMEKGETAKGIQVGKSLYDSNMGFNHEIDKYLYDKGIHSYME